MRKSFSSAAIALAALTCFGPAHASGPAPTDTTWSTAACDCAALHTLAGRLDAMSADERAVAFFGSAHAAAQPLATGIDATASQRTANTVGLSLVGGGQGVKAAQPGVYWLRQTVDGPLDFDRLNSGGLMAHGPAAGIFQVKHDDGKTTTAGWAGYSFSRVFNWGTIGTVVGAADFGKGLKPMLMPRAEIGLGLMAPRLGTTALSVSILPQYLGLGKTTAQIGLDVSF